MATIPGSNNNDTLNGSTASDVFLASTGNDVINGGGGAGSDLIDYAAFAGPVTITYGATGYSGTTAKPGGTTDTFTGIRGVLGTTGNDTLIGSVDTTPNLPFSIILRGNAGDDLIDGLKSQLNNPTYGNATAGVTVTLQTSVDGSGNWLGTASGGGVGTDTLRNVVRATGSNFNDTMTGSAVGDRFDSSGGSDTFNGGGGSNLVDYGNTSAFGTITATYTAPPAGLYTYANASVLKTPSGAGTAVTDTLTGFNQIRGTSGADTFNGLGATVLYSFNVVTMRGNAGNDTFNGFGSGLNRVDYGGATGAVSLDLQTSLDANGSPVGTALADGSGGTDTLNSIRSVAGSGFNDTLLGSFLNDTFQFGNAGLHTVDGRGGTNDARFSGTDSVTIDLALDTLTKAAGTDTLTNIQNATGGAGNDTILGDADGNVLGGASGDNRIDGRAGTDTLSYRAYGGVANPAAGATIDLADGVNGTATNPWGGADTLLGIENAIGSQWADDITGAVLAGGARSYIRGDGANDTLRATAADQAVSADYQGALAGVTVNLKSGTTADDGWFGGTDTLVLIQGVRGSNFNDSITGGIRADVLEGAAGNDSLDGGRGADSLLGGSGNDLFVVDNAGDGTTELAAGGTDTVRASLDWTLAAEIEALELTGKNAQGTGNALANTLTGSSTNNRLSGLLGNDTLLGGDGRDQLDGGTGADRMEGGTGSDVYQVDDLGDVVVELAAGGRDRIESTISLTLGAEVEELTLLGTALNGVGNAADNVILGNASANLLSGLAGNDLLRASQGADTVLGGDGRDTLEGGGGADSLDGGGQPDVFRYTATNHGNDTIVAFNGAQDDVEVSAAAFGGGLAEGVALTAAQFESNATGTASTAAVRFVFHTATLQLRYDADGSGAGGAVTLATLTSGTVTGADILVIA